MVWSSHTEKVGIIIWRFTINVRSFLDVKGLNLQLASRRVLFKNVDTFLKKCKKQNRKTGNKPVIETGNQRQRLCVSELTWEPCRILSWCETTSVPRDLICHLFSLLLLGVKFYFKNTAGKVLVAKKLNASTTHLTVSKQWPFVHKIRRGGAGVLISLLMIWFSLCRTVSLKKHKKTAFNWFWAQSETISCQIRPHFLLIVAEQQQRCNCKTWCDMIKVAKEKKRETKHWGEYFNKVFLGFFFVCTIAWLLHNLATTHIPPVTQ